MDSLSLPSSSSSPPSLPPSLNPVRSSTLVFSLVRSPRSWHYTVTNRRSCARKLEANGTRNFGYAEWNFFFFLMIVINAWTPFNERWWYELFRWRLLTSAMWGTRARSGTCAADETWPRDVDGFANEHQRIVNLQPARYQQRIIPVRDETIAKSYWKISFFVIFLHNCVQFDLSRCLDRNY